MNDPEAIKFINEHVRMRCEGLRALKILMENDLDHWFDNAISTTVPNSDQELVEDGRQGQGVSQLTCDEIHTIMSRIQAVLAPLQEANAMDVINKACVRALTVDTNP